MTCKRGAIGKYDKRVIRLACDGFVVLSKKTGIAYSGRSGKEVGKTIRGAKGTTAYRKISLPIGKRLKAGSRKSGWFGLHRALALVYLGLPPEGMDRVNHKDGNGLNNRLKNLEWCSAKQNTQHAIHVTGTISQNGSKNQMALLTDNDVRDILCSKLREADAALKYKVGFKTIQAIRRGITWKHVLEDVKKTRKYKDACAYRSIRVRSFLNMTDKEKSEIIKSELPIEQLAVKYGRACSSLVNLKRKHAKKIKTRATFASTTKGLKRG